MHFTFLPLLNGLFFHTDCSPDNIERNAYAAVGDKKSFRVNLLRSNNYAETDMPKGNNFSHQWQ